MIAVGIDVSKSKSTVAILKNVIQTIQSKNVYTHYQQSIFSKPTRSNHAWNHIHSSFKEQRP